MPLFFSLSSRPLSFLKAGVARSSSPSPSAAAAATLCCSCSTSSSTVPVAVPPSYPAAALTAAKPSSPLAGLAVDDEHSSAGVQPSLSVSACLLLLLPALLLPLCLLPQPLARPAFFFLPSALLAFGGTQCFIPYWDSKMKFKGITGRDLHKPFPAVISEGMGLAAAFFFILTAVVSQVLLEREEKKLLEYNAGLLSITLMTFLGFADDLLDLPWRVKMLTPLLASIPLLVAYTGRTTILLPDWALPIFSAALHLFSYIGDCFSGGIAFVLGVAVDAGAPRKPAEQLFEAAQALCLSSVCGAAAGMFPHTSSGLYPEELHAEALAFAVLPSPPQHLPGAEAAAAARLGIAAAAARVIDGAAAGLGAAPSNERRLPAARLNAAAAGLSAKCPLAAGDVAAVCKTRAAEAVPQAAARCSETALGLNCAQGRATELCASTACKAVLQIDEHMPHETLLSEIKAAPAAVSSQGWFLRELWGIGKQADSRLAAGWGSLAGTRVVDLGFLYYAYMSLLTIFCTNAINIYAVRSIPLILHRQAAGVNGLEVGQSIVMSFFVLLHNILEIRLNYPLESVSVEAAVIWRQHYFSLILSLLFLASSIALLSYNWYPSKVFVGDTYTCFAGIYFAVTGILGHFSKTLLLLFIPQLLNFFVSLPQLFGLVKCPRHRTPRLNYATEKLESSGNWTLINLLLRAFRMMMKFTN